MQPQDEPRQEEQGKIIATYGGNLTLRLAPGETDYDPPTLDEMKAMIEAGLADRGYAVTVSRLERT